MQKDTGDSQNKKQTDLECIDAVRQILLDVDAKDLRFHWYEISYDMSYLTS